MADEENPLGEGPFGQGPFGPLVATAAAAAAAFSMVTVTISVPLTRTLFYQANIAPPPVAPEVAVVEDNINAATSITTSGVTRKTLFYQSKVVPVGVPAAEVVITTVEWIQPFTRAVSRAPTEIGLYTPFVPTKAPAVTADEWLPAWSAPPREPTRLASGQPFVPKEAVLENTVTPDKWLIAWKGPPSYHPAPAGGSFFGYPYEAAVVSNLTTTLEWMQAWQGPPRYRPIKVQTPPFVPKEATIDNTVDQGWRVPFSTPVAARPVWRTQPVYGFPYEGIDNSRFEWDWQISWQGPPRVLQRLQPGSPFVPREAVLENTQTPDKWLARFDKAVPTPPAHPTQPFLGYPYEAAVVDNTVTPDKWLQPFYKAVPIERPAYSQPVYATPPAPAVTPDKWQISWQGPLRRLQGLQPGSPFVAKEAVLENTQTPDKWLVRFQQAVPVPPAHHTQPFLGYPYEVQAIVVPYEQWWHQPLSRAVATPPVRRQPFQPFVARAVVLENTVTPDKWQISWKGPPRYWPLGKPFQPFVPTAIIETPVTPDKWLVRWQGPPRYQPAKILAQGFVPREATSENTVTPDKWLYRFQQAVPHGWPRHTQPFFGYPYADVFPIGGPADEPERVVCVLPASRVATEPALTRDVGVPVSLRVATVPELNRVVVALDSSEIVQSNLYRDEVCPPFGNQDGIPGVGGIVTPEPSEGDTLLLESGDAVLLESGDSILLEGATSTPQTGTVLLEDGTSKTLLESGDEILLE